MVIGIEVGASRITSSAGDTFELATRSAPHDLLRRVADKTPVLRFAGETHAITPAHDVYVDAIAAALDDWGYTGDTSQQLALVVPGWWSPGVLKLVQDACGRSRVSITLVNEAEAAVAAAVDAHTNIAAPWQTITGDIPEHLAVVRVGARHSSVTLVSDCQEHPQALASPTSVLPEGGHDLDTAVLRHLVDGLLDMGDAVHTGEPGTIAAATVALDACRAVRETLSTSATASLTPQLPGAEHSIRLVRSELEELADPWVQSLVQAVTDTLEQSPVPITTVLLTGGLAQMPLLSQRLSADLRVDVLVAPHPQSAATTGAAHLLKQRSLPVKRRRSLRGLWPWRTTEQPEQFTSHRPTSLATSGAVSR